MELYVTSIYCLEYLGKKSHNSNFTARAGPRVTYMYIPPPINVIDREEFMIAYKFSRLLRFSVLRVPVRPCG